jgi:protease-4
MSETPPPPNTPPHDGHAPWQIPVQTVSPSGAIIAEQPRKRSFAGRVWRFLVGIKDALALLFLLLFFVALFALLSATPNVRGATADGALVLKLNGVVTEQLSNPDPLASLTGGAGGNEFLARDIVRALKQASTNSNVKAIVLDLDGFMGGGQVSLSEISKVLEEVRAKKPVLAYATAYDANSYLLASAASEIWADPNGGVIAVGPGRSRLYYKGLLDRLGVTAHIFRVGTFKSAVEPFMRSDQSPEAKEADLAYANALWGEWKKDVVAARPKAKIDDFTQNMAAAVTAAGGDIAKASANAGLVDHLGGRLAFGQRVAKLAGSLKADRPGDFKAIKLADFVAANPASTSGTAIAVIPVVGEIVDGAASPGTAGGATVSKYILDAVADSNVKAIVLRVDSPGGSVLASEDIRQALLTAKAKKLPIVVSMGNLAASGGYWVSTPADWIVADPATITGSIGVFGIMPSFEKALAKVGVNADGIATTPLSGQPDLYGGVNDEFRTIMQANVEQIYGKFTGIVATSRKQPLEKIQPIAEGRVWAGSTAKELGLVDELGDFNKALAVAAKRAGVTSYYPKYFEKKPSAWNMALAGLLASPEEEDAQARSSVFGVAAGAQVAMQQRLLADMQFLTRTSSVQALCLECGSHRPAPAKALDAEQMGWLMKLASALR